MGEIQLRQGALTEREQAVVSAGFERDAVQSFAPPYAKRQLSWLMHGEDGQLLGVLTADILWDWLYVDELWVDESLRGQGCGRKLMHEAEAYALAEGLAGIWLWTQSWQAAPFYEGLGYEEFARFPDFPRGHVRSGFRKILGIAT